MKQDKHPLQLSNRWHHRRFAFPCFSILMLLAAAWISSSLAAQDEDTTIYIIRHANKDPDDRYKDRDAYRPLSRRGEDLADAISMVLAERGVTAIYSSTYCRTLQTAHPLSISRNLTIHFYVYREQPQPATDGCGLSPEQLFSAANVGLDNLIQRIVRDRENEQVLVVTHSHLINRLLVAARSSERWESGYGRVFAVQITDTCWPAGEEECHTEVIDVTPTSD